MATKINSIRRMAPRGTVLTSSWLVAYGISYSEQADYVKTGWLQRLAQGVYTFAGEEPNLMGAISSFCDQVGKPYHFGATTALTLRGYSHYGKLGKDTAYVFTKKGLGLPDWMGERVWDMNLKAFSSEVFDEEGLENHTQGDLTLSISSPERAIMECLLYAPKYFGLMDTYYIFEMLTTLRPWLVQSLLEKCRSVKVKRLFLFMAEKAKLPCLEDIDTERIDLGKGKRSLAKGGLLDKKYNIIIPRELAEYE